MSWSFVYLTKWQELLRPIMDQMEKMGGFQLSVGSWTLEASRDNFRSGNTDLLTEKYSHEDW
jgi:hypothetical protein